MLKFIRAARKIVLTSVFCLLPVIAWPQAIVLHALPMVILSFNGQTEALNFHTSCSAPLGLDNTPNQRGDRLSLTARLTRADGSEIGHVPYVSCPSRGGFGTLHFRAELDNSGEAMIYVDDVPYGKVSIKGGRVTIGLTPLCDVPCPAGIPVGLDGVVIGKDSGETKTYVRYRLENVFVSSYELSGSGGD